MGNRCAARLSPRCHNNLVSLHLQYILCIQFQEVIVQDTYWPHLVVNVVVAAEPAVAVHPALDGIQPSFSGRVHQRLLEAGDKGAPGLILEGRGVGKNVIHLPARLLQLALHKGFDVVTGLFVLKPGQAIGQSVGFVDTVCPADGHGCPPLQGIDLPVLGKEQIGCLRSE